MACGLAKNAAGQVEGYEIFIKFLPPSATAEGLRSFFSEAGPIVGEPRIMLDSRTGSCKGIAWITFRHKAAFEKAVSWSGCDFNGRKLEIKAGKQFHTGIRPSVQAPGTHTPALCEEVVKKLVAPNPGGIYVDGTFGRGGHTRAMLAAMSPSGSLHAFDMDPEAIAVGKKLMQADPRFTIHHAPFSSMKVIMKKLGLRPSGVLFDLGISSPQFDDAGRGFRPEADGPLDLRFDQTQGTTAWDFLMSAPREEIIRVISEYGETTDALASQRIADVLCLARSRGALPQRTREFAALVAQAKGPEYQAMHPAKLTFQALRIHLNSEFDEMRKGIRAAFSLLTEGGRIGLISWKHSECAIIMDVFRSLEAVRDKEPLLKWYSAQPDAQSLPERWSMEMDEVTRPSEKELQTNSRSRSALLHILRKRRMPRLADLEQMAYDLPAWCNATEPSSSSARKRRKKEKDMAEEPLEVEKTQMDIEETPTGLSGASQRGRRSKTGQWLSEGTLPHMDGCNHCGQGHKTKQCIFGAKPSERFLFCEGVRPHVPCFWRRFVIPLQRADATAFTAEDPRKCGRADVGLRCLSAALFRSQGVRHNTQVCLSFEMSGHTLEVSGALVRGLVPDEPRIAERVRLALDGEALPDPVQEPEVWCASPLRGMEARKRSTKAALKAALKGGEEGCDAGKVVMLLLDADGEPIAEVLKQIRRSGVAQGMVILVGDHRGFSSEDIAGYEKVAMSAGADVVRASLGGTTLLGSHAIVILQHYLDEHMHRCEVAKQVDYGRGR